MAGRNFPWGANSFGLARSLFRLPPSVAGGSIAVNIYTVYCLGCIYYIHKHREREIEEMKADVYLLLKKKKKKV